jgi:N-sulfoglucosamine sulfohydrolase
MSRFFSAFSADPKLEPRPAVRFWGALGRLLLPGRAAPAKPRLQALLRDEFADVRIVASEALAYHGETTDALATLAKIIGSGQPYDVLAALNTLDYAGSLRSRPAPAPRPWGATGN